ncbi:Protein TusB [Candidatus Ecksteinia adelgidicola]|nr:Protein TusB [Candidatus Ecksteinia adelgidicola]
MLYTLSHSPYECDFPALLRIISTDDTLLLLQNGVLAGLINSSALKLLLNSSVKYIYGLKNDLEARGLINYFSEKIIIVGYDHFVKFTEKYHNQIAW